MKGRLLLVEDEEEARCSLVRTLERQGYTCLTAATYEEAAAVLARETVPIDAAVVDIVLGDDDRGGLRVLPLIRALPGKPRVVVITAFADVSRVKEALNGGAAFLLEKPFRATDLIEILGRLLDESELGNYVDRALSRARLTDKETEVARLLLKGLTSQEIARLAANSEKTIRQHVSQVYAKCGVSSRAEFFHFVFPSLRTPGPRVASRRLERRVPHPVRAIVRRRAHPRHLARRPARPARHEGRGRPPR